MSRPCDADAASVTVTDAGSRLHVQWRAQEKATFDAIKDGFRAAFPRHGDALWLPEERCWSLPSHHRGRLEGWLARTFAPGAVTWEDGTPAPENAPSTVARAFATLHLLPTAPPELVTAAHRVMAKSSHPDHPGGSHAAAVAVNGAIALIRAHQQEVAS